MRVFIAENSELMCERLREILSEIRGVEVVGEAHDGAGARRDIARLRPDVLIVDISLRSAAVWTY